jgi:hypothetical protein
MPSSYTSNLRLNLQFTGEAINLWGDILNGGVITLADYAVAGWLTKALTANYALTSANGATDEARAAMLKFTGTGAFTVTIPSVSKAYMVWNACTGDLIVTTGAGTTVTLQTGDILPVWCDGSNVKTAGYGGLTTKQYADQLAFTANAGNLPAQLGNAGKFVTTNGTVASWQALSSTDLGDYLTAILGVQVALAVAL